MSITAIDGQLNSKNDLLRRMPPDMLSSLSAKVERVHLRKSQVLEDLRAPPNFAYFLETAVVSIQAYFRKAQFSGVGLVGSYGMIGLSTLLGAEHPGLRAIVLIPGEALQISVRDLRRFLDSSDAVRQVLFSHAYATLTRTAYFGYCNANHSVDQRVLLWLLTCIDAAGANELRVTHKEVAALLGMRRASVTSSLRALQSIEAVEQQRGHIAVTNRRLLTDRVCECYRATQNRFGPPCCDLEGVSE